MDIAQEQAYENGSQRAWLTMLQTCLTHLGYENAEAQKASWVKERAEVVLKLREICEHHGDNDWSDNLNLSDVLEKHLYNHLEHG